jgi:hypothetical protein
MGLMTLVAASIVFAHAPAALAGQAPQADEPIVQIGVFGYRVDGSNSGAAYDTEPSLESRVYASGKLCQLGAGYRETPAWAMHAWRFSGRVVSKTRDEAVVEVTWQRVLDSGNAVPVPESVSQVALRAGDRTVLETVHGQADSTCSTAVTFEVRYMPRFLEAMRRATRVFGEAPTAAKSGSLARAPDGTGAEGASVRAGGSGLSAAATRPKNWMQVELWLVHTAPDRKDEVTHQLLRAPQEGADFTFAPISIETPRGSVVVQVSGSFGVADGQLIFVTNRSVKYLSSSGRDGAGDTQGTGRTVNAMPGSNDVLSFEMPPIKGSPGGAPLPNQFSVRVRIAR